METQHAQHHPAQQPVEHQVAMPRKRRLILRYLTAILVAILIFAAGLAVGRGNLQINGLSKPTVAANELNYSSVDQVYNLLKANYDGTLHQTKLINGAKAGLVSAAGDPYTVYFDPASAKAFNQELAGTISGIGAELGTSAAGNIEIISPIAGYPAAKAGLQPKDLIVGVNGKSTAGLSVDSIVNQVRGKAGTNVTLTLVRGGGNPFNVTITRQNITVPSVTWSEKDNIGYMRISQFTSDTGALANKAAQEFKDKGVKAVVLDLRGNPGGYLTAAVDVSSLWLKNGQTVVSERRGSTVIDTEDAKGNNILNGLPTVVLIDGGSASASEITAGALHDNKDATLMGQQSFGKGSVQQVENLSDGSEIKITIAHWYTPNGININKKGITPDTVLAPGTNSDQDPQLDKANSYLQSKL